MEEMDKKQNTPSDSTGFKDNFYSRRGKRILDLGIAVPAAVFLSPIIAITAILVRVGLGRPVLFKQVRIGKNERPFTIWKFRTMTDARDKEGNLLPDEKRITRLGALLRKTSLDELPELFNVIRGEMSLVGPRPFYVAYLPYYTPRERLRHAVLPGVTGLAQVSGRNYLLWDERLEADVRYVEKLSFSLDMKILLRTLFQVLSAKDAAVLQSSICDPLFACRRPREDENVWCRASHPEPRKSATTISEGGLWKN